VELSAEGGIDTAYNSRGGDLRLTVSVLGYSYRQYIPPRAVFFSKKKKKERKKGIACP